MRRSWNAAVWIGIGGAFSAAGLALMGVSASLASRENSSYPLWTSAPMFIGYGFFLAATFCFVAAIRSQRSPTRPKQIRTRFDWIDDDLLQIGFQNTGRKLGDAGINVLTPESVTLRRLAPNGSPVSTGSVARTSEAVVEGGEPSSNYWDETSLRIRGGGDSILLRFSVTGAPGEYPIRIRLTDEDLEGGLEVLGTFAIPFTAAHREQDEKRQARTREALQGLWHRIAWNKACYLRAMVRGRYWPLGEGLAALGAWPRLETQLRSDGAPDSLLLAIAEDHREAARIERLIGERDYGNPTIGREDALERAAVASLVALQAIEGELDRIGIPRPTEEWPPLAW